MLQSKARRSLLTIPDGLQDTLACFASSEPVTQPAGRPYPPVLTRAASGQSGRTSRPDQAPPRPASPALCPTPSIGPSLTSASASQAWGRQESMGVGAGAGGGASV